MDFENGSNLWKLPFHIKNFSPLRSTRSNAGGSFQIHFSPNSTADKCKNCPKCGKGFKIGTNEAYNIKIKIRLGGISKIFCFCSQANMAASDKGISLKKKFLKKFLLKVTN